MSVLTSLQSISHTHDNYHVCTDLTSKYLSHSRQLPRLYWPHFKVSLTLTTTTTSVLTSLQSISHTHDNYHVCTDLTSKYLSHWWQLPCLYWPHFKVALTLTTTTTAVLTSLQSISHTHNNYHVCTDLTSKHLSHSQLPRLYWPHFKASLTLTTTTTSVLTSLQSISHTHDNYHVCTDLTSKHLSHSRQLPRLYWPHFKASLTLMTTTTSVLTSLQRISHTHDNYHVCTDLTSKHLSHSRQLPRLYWPHFKASLTLTTTTTSVLTSLQRISHTHDNYHVCTDLTSKDLSHSRQLPCLYWPHFKVSLTITTTTTSVLTSL